MSTPARLAKGTGLTLSRVATAMVGQIATVPIYLSHWDAQTYGVWLILQGMLGYLTLVSVAYQQYTYAEVLKFGPGAQNEVRRIYWSALAVGYLIALAEFGTVLSLAPVAVPLAVPAEAGVPAETVVHLLVLFALLNMVTMSFGSVTGQTLTIYGFYPRTAAWGLIHTAIVLFVPAVAVLLGADLMTAGLAHIAAHMGVALLTAADLWRLARHHGLLAYLPIDWRTGGSYAARCLPLAGRTFIDSFRQQGFRIVLGTYAGTSAVTTLVTTRTFANVLHQGLNTITAPLLPELMRYVVNRDQDRVEGAFAIVWLSLFALLVPGVLLLALLAKPIFLYWTRGAVVFDPVLFLTLLVAVLVYAAGQPALAILQGRNRIAWQIGISVATATLLAAFAALLMPGFGIRGAGVALLAAEIGAAALAVLGARCTLLRMGLDFPLPSMALVALNIGTVFSLALLATTAFSGWPAFMAVPLAANVAFACLYWASLPALARDRIRGVLAFARLPRRRAAPGSRNPE